MCMYILCINYKGHTPYCCVRFILMKYVSYDYKLSQNI